MGVGVGGGVNKEAASVDRAIGQSGSVCTLCLTPVSFPRETVRRWAARTGKERCEERQRCRSRYRNLDTPTPTNERETYEINERQLR